MKLTEIFGQSGNIALVKSMLSKRIENPRNRAFLFHGPTGTGKTSTALALCDYVDADPIMGVARINAGEQLVDNVRDALGSLGVLPMLGTAKVLIVDEADRMTEAVEMTWLHGLENIAEHSLVIFTTNNAEKISQRILDRLKSLDFTPSPDSAQEYAESHWEGRGPVPGIEHLIKSGVSFRRIASYLEDQKIIRESENTLFSLAEKPVAIKPVLVLEDRADDKPVRSALQVLPVIATIRKLKNPGKFLESIDAFYRKAGYLSKNQVWYAEKTLASLTARASYRRAA